MQADPVVGVVEELRASWLKRCAATGCLTGPDDAAERSEMLEALERAAAPGALARVRGSVPGMLEGSAPARSAGTVGARRRALDDAAATWGASLASPWLVVEQMLLLRHLVSGSPEGERICRLVDRAMLGATRAATDELQRAAFSDPLTGCANRRALERDLERELARCARAELDLCVVGIDVDGLKHVNDSEGHASGDLVLLQLVETLRRALRGLDGVYRMGGDEFVVVLPDASPEDAGVVMTRVADLGAPAFSWGAASVQALGRFDAALLLQEADNQLYERRRARRAPGLEAPAVRPRLVATAGASRDPQAGAAG